MKKLPQYLVIGKSGQVARAWQRIAGGAVVAVGRDECDLENTSSIREKIEKIVRNKWGPEGHPLVVVLAAAYTQVDKAESEEKLAFAVNRDAVSVIAELCVKWGAVLLHYSTDYVYAGDGETVRTEDDVVAPMSVYGKSKFAGEQEIAKRNLRYLIFRTSWVYDESGKNFLNTMLNLASQREQLRVVCDQWGAPTYAADLVELSYKAVQKGLVMETFPSGVYHLCNGGETNWHQFAVEIFNQTRSRLGMHWKLKEVLAIPTKEYPTPAVRPLNSRMSCDKFKSTFGLEIHDWKQALKKCLERKL